MTRSSDDVFQELLVKPPAEQLEIAAELVKDPRPEMIRLGWSLARRAVTANGAAEAIAMMEKPSAERGLARMRKNLKGGGA